MSIKSTEYVVRPKAIKMICDNLQQVRPEVARKIFQVLTNAQIADMLDAIADSKEGDISYFSNFIVIDLPGEDNE